MNWQDYIDELQEHPSYKEARFLGGEDRQESLFECVDYRWRSEKTFIVYFAADDLAMMYEKEQGWRRVLIGEKDEVNDTGYSRNKLLANSERLDYLFDIVDEFEPENGLVPVYGEEHPKFIKAMQALDPIRGDDSKIDEQHQLMVIAMQYAPLRAKKMLDEQVMKSGLLPKATFYTENGEPVFSAEQMAEHLGLSVEEVISQSERIASSQPDCFKSVDNTKLHRKH